MRLDDQPRKEDEGPIKIIDKAKVPEVPSSLIDGFEWVTMDLTDEKEVRSRFYWACILDVVPWRYEVLCIAREGMMG
jgi:hypothetical protein